MNCECCCGSADRSASQCSCLHTLHGYINVWFSCAGRKLIFRLSEDEIPVGYFGSQQVPVLFSKTKKLDHCA